jgi:DNA-binding NtrC family response regulator
LGLKGYKGDKQAAARVLGIAFSMLYTKLKKYQL